MLAKFNRELEHSLNVFYSSKKCHKLLKNIHIHVRFKQIQTLNSIMKIKPKILTNINFKCSFYSLLTSIFARQMENLVFHSIIRRNLRELSWFFLRPKLLVFRKKSEENVHKIRTFFFITFDFVHDEDFFGPPELSEKTIGFCL